MIEFNEEWDTTLIDVTDYKDYDVYLKWEEEFRNKALLYVGKEIYCTNSIIPHNNDYVYKKGNYYKLREVKPSVLFDNIMYPLRIIGLYKNFELKTKREKRNEKIRKLLEY